MASRRDQERIRALLTEAITVLCKNGLGYNSEFCIDGLLGITVDNEDIFLVKINEKIAREKRVLHLSLEDHHSSGHGERYSVDQGSITSASPDLNSSLSQPPTPKNFNAHAPRNHHNASSEFQCGESSSLSPKASPPRKRHWDCQTPEPEPKRSHNGALSNSGPTNVVVVKEEFVNSSMEYEVIGELNGDSGVGGGAGHMSGRAWAQAATPTHPYLTNMSSNTAAGVTAYEASQDESSLGCIDMLPPFTTPDSMASTPFSSSDGNSQHVKSVMLNNRGRLIAKGMPLPNSERQLIIKTILEGGGNAETGKTPYGFLRAVANSFHIQSSTVHNIWTRYWKYRVDTHGYCPGISDHKRQVNKKCKERKQKRKDPNIVDVEDIKGLNLNSSRVGVEAETDMGVGVIGEGIGPNSKMVSVNTKEDAMKSEPLNEGGEGLDTSSEQLALTEEGANNEGVNIMKDGATPNSEGPGVSNKVRGTTGYRLDDTYAKESLIDSDEGPSVPGTREACKVPDTELTLPVKVKEEPQWIDTESSIH